MLRLVLLATAVCLCMGHAPNPEVNSRMTATEVVQFDAIIELDAPLLKSHIVLFARYWVAPTFYEIAVLWAEPHGFNLNFPMYPVTMTVDSNEQSFSVINQVHSQLGRTFDRPVGERPVFRHRLNSYPIGDVRFTETEALASRIYRDDLEGLAPPLTDGLHTVNLAGSARKSEVKRDMAALKLQVSNNRVDTVEIVDANGLLVKKIAYEYSRGQGRDILCGQEVLLPERPLLLGYGERGVTIRVNDQERTFKELYGLDHAGGRKCSVEYEAVGAGDSAWAFPTRIVVRRADSGVVLRTARMSGFAHLTLTVDKVREAAKQIGRFSPEELRVRALSAKYWRKDPNEVTSDDADALERLREHFETPVPDETVGQRLRRMNMLMQVAWTQGDRLIDHFRQQLVLLNVHGLDRAALIGGLNAINTTIQRKQYTTADELVRAWARHVIARTDAQTLLAFGRSQVKRGHLWTIVRLLEEGGKSADGWGQKRFDAQALRCISCYELLLIAQEPSGKKSQAAVMQAAWASQSLDLHNLTTLVGETLADAKCSFGALAKPDGEQMTLRRELDMIEEHVRKVNCPQSPDRFVP